MEAFFEPFGGPRPDWGQPVAPTSTAPPHPSIEYVQLSLMDF